MIWASWLSSWGCSEECEKWCSFITNQVCKRSYSEVQDGRCKPSSNTNVKWVKFVYHIEVLLEHFNFTITQPDLSFSVSKIFQSLHQPLNTLLKSVRSILRYVKGVMDQGITSQRSSYLLTSYRDADWVTSPDDRCFVSLFFLFFVFWKGITSLSSRSSQQSPDPMLRLTTEVWQTLLWKLCGVNPFSENLTSVFLLGLLFGAIFLSQ